MLYAILICSDESCAEEHEAFGELHELDDLVCPGCGCVLLALAFGEVHEEPAPVPLQRAA